MKLFRRHREPSEATRARQAAERQLERDRAQTEEDRRLAEALRRIRERNHLAEGIEAALRRREA